MSGWGLGYDVQKKVWSDEQLEILGIDRKYMPRIVKPWDKIGGLSEEMAAATGLKAGTPVLGGAGDTMQSMLGAGIFCANQGVDVAGTCAMFCVSTSGIIPELSRPGTGLIFNSGTLPDTYFYWGFVRTGGLSLRWFKDHVCQKEGDSSYYQHLSAGAAKVPAGCNGVLFLPYLTGGSGEEKEASGCFLNMTMDDDQFVMWRSVLEAIGYDYIGLADSYRAAGVNLDRITVTEGGSRDPLWNQIKSHMLNADIVRFKNAGGAVLTNCILGAYAIGEEKDMVATLQANISLDGEYHPDAELTKRYRRLYEARNTLMREDMKAAFSRLVSMREPA